MISEGGTQREHNFNPETQRTQREAQRSKNKLEVRRRIGVFAGAGAEVAERAEERYYGRGSDIPAWLLVPTGVSAAGLAGIHLRSGSKRDFNLSDLRWRSGRRKDTTDAAPISRRGCWFPRGFRRPAWPGSICAVRRRGIPT